MTTERDPELDVHHVEARLVSRYGWIMGVVVRQASLHAPPPGGGGRGHHRGMALSRPCGSASRHEQPVSPPVAIRSVVSPHTFRHAPLPSVVSSGIPCGSGSANGPGTSAKRYREPVLSQMLLGIYKNLRRGKASAASTTDSRIGLETCWRCSRTLTNHRPRGEPALLSPSCRGCRRARLRLRLHLAGRSAQRMLSGTAP